MKSSLDVVLFVSVPALLAPLARAQCESKWAPEFGAVSLVSGDPFGDDPVSVEALFVVDDPTGGDDLFIGGQFIQPSSTRALMHFDGNYLHAMGAGFTAAPSGDTPTVFSMVQFDAGNGPELIAGGLFTKSGTTNVANIARWDGTQWDALGPGIGGGGGFPLSVRSMAVYDDGLGAGPALYVTGFFTLAGGQSANAIARWDGEGWSTLGSGFDGMGEALAVFDDGDGPALYAGGGFTHAGGVEVNHLARWDGRAWTAVGNLALPTVVSALLVHDGALYVGGTFPEIGGVSSANIARFDGTSWTGFGTGVTAPSYSNVSAIAFHPVGGVPMLHVSGTFIAANGVAALNVARWNGTTFEPLGAGVTNSAAALCSYDSGAGFGPELIVGGTFGLAGGTAIPTIAKWNGASWSRLAAAQGLNSTVRALAGGDIGDGTALYAGGDFTRAGDVAANRVARFDGRRWTALGSGISGTPGSSIPAVHDLQLFDAGLGAGPELYAIGYFSQAGGLNSKCIARWNGSAWSSVAGGVNGTNGVATLQCGAVFDAGAGPALYVCGDFNSAGGVPATNFAKWNGTSWSAETMFPRPWHALDMLVFDDGDGMALYAVGEFVLPGGSIGPGRIGRFDGNEWTILGIATNGRSLAAYDDGQGGGLDLYVGGPFTTLSGVVVNGIGHWNGSEWMPLGSGVSPASVLTIGTFDDGAGSQLYAVGGFTTASGTQAASIARWNGRAWSALDGGLIGSALVMTSVDLGPPDGNGLFLAGTLVGAGDFVSSFIARWGPDCPGYAFCTGDGLDPFVTTPCPCGNVGASGHGCANSFEPEGALLSTSGSTALDEPSGSDTVVLHGSQMPTIAGCTYLKGNIPVLAGVVFGDGVRCAGGSLIRLGSKTNVDGVSQYPEPGDLSLSEHGQTPIGSGVTAYYQTSYRNATSFCTAATFNMTNGVRIVW